MKAKSSAVVANQLLLEGLHTLCPGVRSWHLPDVWDNINSFVKGCWVWCVWKALNISSVNIMTRSAVLSMLICPVNSCNPTMAGQKWSLCRPSGLLFPSEAASEGFIPAPELRWWAFSHARLRFSDHARLNLHYRSAGHLHPLEHEREVLRP